MRHLESRLDRKNQLIHRAVVPVLTLTVAVGIPAVTFADPPSNEGWEEGNRTPSIVVWSRDNKQAGAREVWAEGDVDSPPATVLGVIVDHERYKDFMPYVKESRVFNKQGDKHSSYMMLSLPFVDNRDYCIDMKESKRPDGTLVAEWWSIPCDVGPRDGIVRITLNQGSWTLQPRDAGRKTHITYRVLTNPGGSIPRWVANKSNTVSVPKVFEAVSSRAQSLRK